MTSASEWVRQVLAKSQEQPMATEDVLKSLERFAGHGERALRRVQDIVDYMDSELVERRGGVVLRDLFATVTDYQEKVLESAAAA